MNKCSSRKKRMDFGEINNFADEKLNFLKISFSFETICGAQTRAIRIKKQNKSPRTACSKPGLLSGSQSRFA